MKYIKSINEKGNPPKMYYVLFFKDDQNEISTLGVFDSFKDLQIYILNYVNEEIDENDGRHTLVDIEHYTKEKDEQGRYVFIDPDSALNWINHYFREQYFELSWEATELKKPVLLDRIKDYMEIIKYNL